MKKFLKITAIVIVLLLAAVVALPFIFKGKIIEMVKKEANKQLTATLAFDNDIKIKIFKSFPDFTLELKKFSIADSSSSDTLVSVQKFSATLDIMSVIKGDKIEIKSIILDNPRIYAKMGKDGKANWDIMKPSTDTATATPADTTSSFKLGLKKFQIINGRVVYDDQMGAIYAELNGLNHELKGDFTQDLFMLETKTDASEVTVGMAGLNYLNKVKTYLKADLEMDMKNMKFTFKQNELQLNELLAGFDGYVSMPKEDIEMDLKFAARKTEFKNILSLVPAVFTKDFANVKTSGKLALDGMLKGIYNEKSLPAFNINLQITEGMFQYPGMPADMKQIFVDLNVNNPDGVIDNTIIDLKKLTFVMANEPFQARLLAKNPTTDPYVDMDAKGRIDLGNVSKIVPLDKGTSVSGLIAADMSAKGRVSTVEAGKYDQFDASGNITATNVVYITDSLPKTTITTAQLNFTPKLVELPVFAAQLGNSDVAMKGFLSNFFGYLLGGQTLKGELEVNSKVFDANQYITGSSTGTDAPKPEDTVKLAVVEIPKNIDFGLKMNIGKLFYDNLELRNVGGSVKVADQAMVLKDVHTDIFGGNITMNGTYSTVNPLQPKTDMQLAITAIDAGEAFKYMNTVKKLMPIAQYLNGKISAKLDLNTLLGGDMMPLLSSITGGGRLEIPRATVAGYPPANALGEALKIDKLKSLDINKILLLFKIENGRVSIDPVKLTQYGIGMVFSGSSGLDQSLDYDLKLEVPRSLFGQANGALDNLLGEVGKKGIALKPNEIINVNALIGGFTFKPTIKTSMKDLVKNTVDDLKDAAKQKIEEVKEDVKDKVDAEFQKRMAQAIAAGDRIKAEAKKTADAMRAAAQKKADEEYAKAQKAADDAINKAGNNPVLKPAAKKVAEKLLGEGKKKADKILTDENAAADKIEQEAQKKADQLVKEAEATKDKGLGR